MDRRGAIDKSLILWLVAAGAVIGFAVIMRARTVHKERSVPRRGIEQMLRSPDIPDDFKREFIDEAQRLIEEQGRMVEALNRATDENGLPGYEFSEEQRKQLWWELCWAEYKAEKDRDEKLPPRDNVPAEYHQRREELYRILADEYTQRILSKWEVRKGDEGGLVVEAAAKNWPTPYD